MNWLISDTHYNHENIIGFCRSEFANPDDMNSHIVKVWNEYIKPDDDVWHLGDFALKTGLKKEETRNLFKQLNGRIHLIRGNHDNLKQIKDFGWTSIQDEEFIIINGVKFRMTHFSYPWGMTEMDKQERPECKTEPIPNPETGEIYPLLNGHVHKVWAVRKNCLNVGWDIWKRPINTDDVWRIFEETKGFTIETDKIS